MVLPFIQFAPRRAFAAARALAADPDDLPQVFTLIESLSGTALHRLHRRLVKSPAGARLLTARPDIVDLLADRSALARLPDGTLGRAYLDFVEREKISAEGIRAAEKDGMTRDAPPVPLDFINARLRDTHDLWHAAVGYQGDILGETALLAFTYAQTWTPAIGLMAGIGLAKLGSAQASRVVADGFRRGRRAAWLPEQDWESLLPLPLAEVRDRLRLEAPPIYTPLRSAELRAMGNIAA